MTCNANAAGQNGQEGGFAEKTNGDCVTTQLEAYQPAKFFQLSTTAQPDATCNNLAPRPTQNASHTQAWSPSPCSHTRPRDHASDFILHSLKEHKQGC